MSMLVCGETRSRHTVKNSSSSTSSASASASTAAPSSAFYHNTTTSHHTSSYPSNFSHIPNLHVEIKNGIRNTQCKTCMQLRGDLEKNVQINKKLHKRLKQCESKLDEYEEEMYSLKEQILYLSFNLNRLGVYITQQHKLVPLTNNGTQEPAASKPKLFQDVLSLPLSKNVKKKDDSLVMVDENYHNSIIENEPIELINNNNNNNNHYNHHQHKDNKDKDQDQDQDQNKDKDTWSRSSLLIEPSNNSKQEKIRKTPRIIHHQPPMLTELKTNVGSEYTDDRRISLADKETVITLLEDGKKQFQIDVSGDHQLLESPRPEEEIEIKEETNQNDKSSSNYHPRNLSTSVTLDQQILMVNQKSEPIIIEEPEMSYTKGQEISEELIRRAFEKLCRPSQSDDEAMQNSDHNLAMGKRRRNSIRKIEGITFESFCYGVERLWILWDIDECKIMFNKLALVSMKCKSSDRKYDGNNHNILKHKFKVIGFDEFREALLYWPDVFGYNENDIKDFEILINRLIVSKVPQVKIFGKSGLQCVEDLSDLDGEGHNHTDIQNSHDGDNKNKSTAGKNLIDEESPIIINNKQHDRNCNGIASAAPTTKKNIGMAIMKEDDIYEQLKDYRNNKWQLRIKALKQLERLFATPEGGIDTKSFVTKFQRFKEPLAHHIKDRRTVVCKESCKLLIKIIEYRKTEFYPFIAFFIERCLEIIRDSVQVMSQSGDEAVMAIITNIPEDEDTHLILKALTSAFMRSNRKYAKSREHIIKYVHQIMFQEHNSSLIRDHTYIDKLCTLIAEGCKDADAAVRSQSFETLKTLQLKVDSTKAQKIVNRLSPGALRKYRTIMTDQTYPNKSSSQQNKSKVTTEIPEKSKTDTISSIQEMKEQMKKKEQMNKKQNRNNVSITPQPTASTKITKNTNGNKKI